MKRLYLVIIALIVTVASFSPIRKVCAQYEEPAWSGWDDSTWVVEPEVVPAEDYSGNYSRYSDDMIYSPGSRPEAIYVLLFLTAVMAMAALFVIRPEKMKVVPYIVLVVTGIAYVCLTLSYRNYVFYNSYHYLFAFEACRFRMLFVAAIPIVTLLVMTIVLIVKKTNLKQL